MKHSLLIFRHLVNISYRNTLVSLNHTKKPPGISGGFFVSGYIEIPNQKKFINAFLKVVEFN